jgi:hypothetical protein
MREEKIKKASSSVAVWERLIGRVSVHSSSAERFPETASIQGANIEQVS